MATPKVRTIMAFHTIDRAIYEKFISHGIHPELAQNAVCLFMWLDQIGFEVVRQILPINNPSAIFALITDAEAILHCLRQEEGIVSHVDIPFVSALSQDIIGIRFFDFHKDVIVRGLAQIIDGVGRIIFDENLYEILHLHNAAVRQAELDSAICGRRLMAPPLPLELTRPWDPRAFPVSTEDGRSMFITFSKGFPIRREEITEYFNERWGDCIERVMMERTPPGGTPMYGRIVFKSESFIRLVLNGERVLKFTINGRQLWARKYVPRFTS
ncbi:hypothetical protein LUZ60_014418 [Juncus effusus]|nr:hypothetical protein LUZ60_014418 [Juncus effusus]